MTECVLSEMFLILVKRESEGYHAMSIKLCKDLDEHKCMGFVFVHLRLTKQCLWAIFTNNA